MVSIQRCSIRDRNRPIISFFGRPGDPRKGLLSFLDALTVIDSISFVPQFSVWIVGGSDAEIELIDSLSAARPVIAQRRADGTISVWGRVATEALPELYSRSSLVVIPSSREQFGIVAIEAMMCETPVIASQVGGLTDIVLDGHTGTLVPVDQPSALANAILGYLRNRDRVRREGANARRWAVRGFSRNETYSRYESVYRAGAPQRSFPSRSGLRADELSQLKEHASVILGEVVSAEDRSSSDHTSAQLTTTAGARYFAKWYRPERADHISVLPVAAELRRERTIADYAGRLLFHRNNSSVPRIVRFPTESAPLAIFEWCTTRQPESPIHELHNIAKKFRAYQRLEANEPDVRQYLETVRAVAARRDLASIAAHDAAASALNGRLSTGDPRFQQVHPQIELLRMSLLLCSDAWAIEADARQRFIATIRFVLNESAILDEVPAICHGSLKTEHLLSRNDGAVVACDTDSSRYVVGPFDEVHQVWNDIKASPTFGPFNALSRLRAMLEPNEHIGLAASWLLVYLVFDALLTITNGGDVATTRAIRFARDLPYLWKRFVTPSK
ncbi:MAG TPA: glycosyltransferase family 4 protein [Thermoanaerobaculia bacterium]|nr:glycosyltransferase family 4 protein [Thermoanaerobaculia bacterium]